MKKQKGVILVLTVTFMLIFTLFGLAAMNFAGFQGQGIVRKVASTQAFWIAEAGIQRAASRLSQGNLGFILNGFLNQGNYNVNVTPTNPLDPDPVRWNIDSVGNQQPIAKEILVEYGPALLKGLESEYLQSINKEQNVPSREENVTLNFSDFFDFNISNMTQSQKDNTPFGTNCTVGNKVVTYYPIPTPSKHLPDYYSGISYIDSTTHSNQETIPNLAGDGLVIIQVRDGTGLSINGGGNFNGIVWIQGKLDGLGSTVINGAVLVDCGTQLTTVSGNAQIYYNQTAIDDAFKNLRINKFAVVSWEEVK